MLISEYYINFSWQSRSVLWKLSLIQNFIIIFLLIINQFSGYYLTYTGLLKKKIHKYSYSTIYLPKKYAKSQNCELFFLFRKIMFSIVSFTKFKKYLLKSKVIYSLLKNMKYIINQINWYVYSYWSFLFYKMIFGPSFFVTYSLQIKSLKRMKKLMILNFCFVLQI